MRIAIASVALICLVGCGTNSGSQNQGYDPESPNAPSQQTVRDIDKLQGSLADKQRAKAAVQRFKEEAAKRGDRPIKGF